MLRTKVVSAKAAKPSGPGSAGVHPSCTRAAPTASRPASPAVGSRPETAADSMMPSLIGSDPRQGRDAPNGSYRAIRNYPNVDRENMLFRQIIHEDLGCASYLV